jgi:hypothetical protein
MRELDEQNVSEQFCECDESIPRHVGAHPQTCRKCGRMIE